MMRKEKSRIYKMGKAQRQQKRRQFLSSRAREARVQHTWRVVERHQNAVFLAFSIFDSREKRCDS